MKRITFEREKRNWSKAELARQAGLHPVQIGQFEAGRLVPYRGQLLKLAHALGLPEDAAATLMAELEAAKM